MTIAGLPLPPVDAGLDARVRTSLEEVEKRLTASVASDTGFVTETASHLIVAGGKRFRPLLAVLAAEFGDPSAPEVIETAVVVELMHIATLYHDDVMDEAPLRRGAPSANTRWNNTVAILTGDYLFARVSEITTELGLPTVRIQARTLSRLVDGQLRETLGPAEGQDPLAHYLDVLSDKTGSLIATSARLGALHAGASPEIETVVTDFGEKIGIAFQLSDDVIDIASTSAETGKTPGTDLREGIATLPVLLARRSGSPSDAHLFSLLDGDLTDDAKHAEVLSLLRQHPAMAESRAFVQKWADDARATLTALPNLPASAALSALCDLVVSRTG
ncbi:polyprenyl synthetase family protein [Tenggerimyces flavus]|uniref:Polyprenyl synthetase family protein n=1 Tax=Tenggerimyces flavus TaxID=1708749 RepID=A0ABV7Y6U3_9ACTN|nr:polyprenyl synthetase family protein [Tenggerimyces flavus]MBM7791186.1 heptaprenyl diphosphate synthase [Tenggerimyces flavus]